MHGSVAGGLVAGLDAGLTYNTFPLMDGKFIPDGLLSMSPVFLNFFENVTTVQFGHRMMAYGSILFVSFTVWQARAHGLSKRQMMLFYLFAALMVVQVLLGVTTLLWAVPIPLGALHQFAAFLLLTAGLWSLHSIRIRG